jgi:SAM-dependent methyltransferase
MRTWIDYWNSDHAIYVNGRHRILHAEGIAQGILGLLPSSNAIVLDQGSGEALYAEALAAHCSRLILCEAAPTVRKALASRVANLSNVSVIDAGDVARLDDRSLDLVIANSLIQYLKRDELAELLDIWHRKLRSDGSLVVADVIPPDVSPVTDAAALLRFGWSGGFLGPALVGLAKTALSDYRQIRAALGFATYSEQDFLALLADHGFDGARIYPNVGHNQARMTFRARPR